MSYFNSITQNIEIVDGNSTNSNITVGSSWTGTATETLYYDGFDFSIKADQNLIIYLEQSTDGINWDISDKYFYYYVNDNKSATVQIVGNYVRARIVHNGIADTTYLRFVTHLNPITNPLPRSLNDESRLVTETVLTSSEVHKHVAVSPTNELYTTDINRLVGKSFSGTSLDTNFWKDTSTNGGYYEVGGGIDIYTGTNAAGSSIIESVQKARFVSGSSNGFRALARFGQDPSDGYKASMGVYDDDDGFFFIIEDSSFGVVTRKAGVDTVVWNGDFNGNVGNSIGIPLGNGNVGTATNLALYSIIYNVGVMEFYVSNKLIHTISAVNGALVNSLSKSVRAEIENIGNTNNNYIDIRGIAVMRIGNIATSPIFKHVEGAVTTVLKRGAGILHTIVNTNNSGSGIIYDGLDDTGEVIAVIDFSKILGTLDFKVNYSNGIYLETSGPAVNITIVYE